MWVVSDQAMASRCQLAYGDTPQFHSEVWLQFANDESVSDAGYCVSDGNDGVARFDHVVHQVVRARCFGATVIPELRRHFHV